MAADEQSIQLVIQARNQAASVVGQATFDLAKWAEELKKAKAAADGSSESNRRLGEAVLKHRDALMRHRDALKESAVGTGTLSAAQTKLHEALAAGSQQLAGQAGALGQFAASFGGVALAAAAAAGAIAGIVTVVTSASKSIGDFQEKQDILADQLDLTQREIGALTLGAANVGRTFESIQPSLFTFTRRLGEARAGSEEAKKSFRDLGINPQKDLRSTAEILRSVGSALDNLGDKTKRNALLVELFGRGGSQVLPILRQDFDELADTAERTGIVLSESAQRTAREADEAWDKLGAATIGLRNTIQVSLAPLGTFLVDIFGKIVTAAAEAGRSLDNVNFDSLREEMKQAGESADRASEKIKKVLEGRGSFSEAELTNLGPLDAAQGSKFPTTSKGQQGPPVPIGFDLAGAAAASEARRVALADTKAINAEQQAQMDQLRETIRLLDLRSALMPNLIDDELKALDAMRDQVKSRAELLVIDQKIAALRSKQIQEAANEPVRSAIQDATGEFLTLEQVRRERARKQAQDEGGPEPRNIRPESQRGVADTREKSGGNFEDKVEKQREEILNAQEDFENNIAKVANVANQSILALRDFAHGVSVEGKSLISTLGQFVSSILSIISQLTHNSALGPIAGVISTISSLFGQSGGKVGPSPILAQSGGVLPILAQSGTILSGVRGVDSQRALLGRGEAVLSHALTDKLERFLQTAGRAQPAAQVAAQRAVVAPGGAAGSVAKLQAGGVIQAASAPIRIVALQAGGKLSEAIAQKRPAEPKAVGVPAQAGKREDKGAQPKDAARPAPAPKPSAPVAAPQPGRVITKTTETIRTIAMQAGGVIAAAVAPIRSGILALQTGGVPVRPDTKKVSAPARQEDRKAAPASASASPSSRDGQRAAPASVVAPVALRTGPQESRQAQREGPRAAQGIQPVVSQRAPQESRPAAQRSTAQEARPSARSAPASLQERGSESTPRVPIAAGSPQAAKVISKTTETIRTLVLQAGGVISSSLAPIRAAALGGIIALQAGGAVSAPAASAASVAAPAAAVAATVPAVDSPDAAQIVIQTGGVLRSVAELQAGGVIQKLVAPVQAAAGGVSSRPDDRKLASVRPEDKRVFPGREVQAKALGLATPQSEKVISKTTETIRTVVMPPTGTMRSVGMQAGGAIAAAVAPIRALAMQAGGVVASVVAPMRAAALSGMIALQAGGAISAAAAAPPAAPVSAPDAPVASSPVDTGPIQPQTSDVAATPPALAPAPPRSIGLATAPPAAPIVLQVGGVPVAAQFAPSPLKEQTGGAPRNVASLQAGGVLAGGVAPIRIIAMQAGGVIERAARVSAPFLAQTGGMLSRVAALPPPIYAQSGLVMSGSRGVDTERALVGRGEMVVSHAETEFIQRVLGRLEGVLDKGSSGGATAAPSTSVTLSPGAIQIRTGPIGNRQEFRKMVNEELMPELSRAIRLGTFSR